MVVGRLIYFKVKRKGARQKTQNGQPTSNKFHASKLFTFICAATSNAVWFVYRLRRFARFLDGAWRNILLIQQIPTYDNRLYINTIIPIAKTRNSLDMFRVAIIVVKIAPCKVTNFFCLFKIIFFLAFLSY
jgi:hypothetical protein